MADSYRSYIIITSLMCITLRHDVSAKIHFFYEYPATNLRLCTGNAVVSMLCFMRKSFMAFRRETQVRRTLLKELLSSWWNNYADKNRVEGVAIGK